MAEFSEVMRQFDRMCKAHAGCVDCRLAIKGSTETKCSIGSFIDESEYIEREIMQWAAEHPMAYPTWLEWMKSMGIIPYMMGLVTAREEDGTFCDGHVNITEKALKPIPADIAQKLGIEPKEG